MDDEETTTQRQRQAILADLRVQAERGEEALEGARTRQREMAKEVAELRGRLAHTAKEQGQWEQDLKAQEEKQCSAAMDELRRLRKARPDAAARYASDRRVEKKNGADYASDRLLE